MLWERCTSIQSLFWLAKDKYHGNKSVSSFYGSYYYIVFLKEPNSYVYFKNNSLYLNNPKLTIFMGY